jgi:hypothetical protein
MYYRCSPRYEAVNESIRTPSLSEAVEIFGLVVLTRVKSSGTLAQVLEHLMANVSPISIRGDFIRP